MTDDRHYFWVAREDLAKLPPDAVCGEEADDGRTIVKLRAERVEDLPPLPKSAEMLARGVEVARSAVESRTALKRAARAIAESAAEPIKEPARE